MFRQLGSFRKMQTIAIFAVTWVCAGFPVEAQHPELLAAEHPELAGDTEPGPASPKEVIPVPVVPDKMAVPAPTVRDTIKKPGEAPAVRSGGPHTIPEPERKEVTPPATPPPR